MGIGRFLLADIRGPERASGPNLTYVSSGDPWTHPRRNSRSNRSDYSGIEFRQRDIGGVRRIPVFVSLTLRFDKALDSPCNEHTAGRVT